MPFKDHFERDHFGDEATRDAVASAVRKHKALYPSWYCRQRRCLHRLDMVRSSGYCWRHEGPGGGQTWPDRFVYAANGEITLPHRDA